MRTITLYDGQFNEQEFYLFTQWPFDCDEVHVGFVLENGSGVTAIAYAWNLGSIEQANTATEIEIALIEVHADLRGKGLGTQLMRELGARYDVTVYGVENERFFSGLGYSLDEKRSLIDKCSFVWTK